MWIMLIKKLPTKPSPPKMSIFWAIPWKGEYGEKMFRKGLMQAYCDEHSLDYFVETYNCNVVGRESSESNLWKRVQDAIAKGDWEPPNIEDGYSSPVIEEYQSFGHEPNWAGAMAIQYKSEQIRVFPHEFSKLDDGRLKEYIVESHEFVAGETPEGEALKTDMELSPEKRYLYEAAVLEGASQTEAILLSAGLLQIEDGTEVKPTGWYRCRPEYAQIFCNNDEME